jgi:hypothetical protein
MVLIPQKKKKISLLNFKFPGILTVSSLLHIQTRQGRTKKFLSPKLLRAKGIGGSLLGNNLDSAQWARIAAHQNLFWLISEKHTQSR